MLAGGLLFGWRCHVAPDTDARLGEFSPHKDDGLIAFDARTGGVKRDFPGKRRAVAGDGTLYMSGSTLVAGGQETVTAIAAGTGQIAWQDQVNGQARSLAVADGRLLVSTTTGQIICYGPEAVADPPVISSEARAPAFADDNRDSSPAFVPFGIRPEIPAEIRSPIRPSIWRPGRVRRSSSPEAGNPTNPECTRRCRRIRSSWCCLLWAPKVRTQATRESGRVA